MEKSAQISYSKSKGFALAEVVVALFIATIAIALVAGLGQQVMDLAKRSSQTGTVLELRSMVNSISRNPTTWIEKMRGSVNLQGLYAGCIPDPKLNISTFLCPDIAPDLLANDKELATIAGSGFYASSAPIINSNGELIAGTVENPVYLTSDGRLCEKGNCAFKSTGYFLRSNDKNNKDPGSVKFVIKVEKNKNSENNAPMKPQYLSIHIGEEWKSFDASDVCPVGTIKIGYLSSGKPSCTNPSSKCSGAGQYSIGIDSDGKTICKTLPTSCPANSGYTLNSAGNDLACATSSAPCGANNIFLGYFGGSGEPMCSGSEIKCPANQLQVGISIAAGQMTAKCAEPPPACTDASTRLTYDGDKFVCQSQIAEGSLPASSLTCASGQVMYGINGDGSVKCKSLALKCGVQTKRSSQSVWGPSKAFYTEATSVTCNDPGDFVVSCQTVTINGDTTCLTPVSADHKSCAVPARCTSVSPASAPVTAEVYWITQAQCCKAE
jgi:hypothetical protein